MTSAKPLRANVESKACFQGQTHGHAGFLLKREEAEQLIASDEKYLEVLFPFLTADEMIGSFGSFPKRYVIDFRKHDIFSAQEYIEVFNIIKNTVLLDRQKKAKQEEKKNETLLIKNPKSRVNRHHANFLRQW